MAINWQPIEGAPKDRVILLYTTGDVDMECERFGAGFWEDMRYDLSAPEDGFWIHNLGAEPTHWAPAEAPK